MHYTLENHEQKRNTLPPKLPVLIAQEINFKGTTEEAIVTKRVKLQSRAG